MNKPYYVIDLRAVDCKIDIRINDVSVLSMTVDGQTATMLPINNAIVKSGKQQVSHNILPLSGKTTLEDTVNFSASVWLYDAGGDLIEKKEEISKFTMPENKTGFPLPAYKGEDVFYAEIPYKLNAWQNSQDLTKVEKLRELVDAAYRKTEELINNAQYNQLANMLQKREDNIAISLYLSESEKKGRMLDLIDIMETGFKNIPISEEDTMVIYGNDKLVALRKEDGKSALLLKNKYTGEELNLEIQFHLEQDNNELTII